MKEQGSAALQEGPASFLLPLCRLQAQDYLLWCSQQIGVMAAEESISDVATADLQLAQHQQLWAEMEARQETYQQALDMGETLQTQDRRNRKEVRRRRKEAFQILKASKC